MGTWGWRSATACRSMGFENRMSKGEGSPSLSRTPTLRTPQWTKTARLPCSAHSNTARASSPCTGYPCIAGKRHATRISENVSGFQARGFTMAYAKKRSGWARTAAATDASLPGALPIRAARFTPWRSNSRAHVSASFSGSGGGNCQSNWPRIPSSVSPGFCAARISKKRCEKKWTCASATTRGPHGDCLAMSSLMAGAIAARQLGEAGGKRELRKPGDVIDAQLLHHGLAVAAHGLLAQVQQNGDFLAGFALGHHAQHLHFARGKRFQRSGCVFGFQVALLDAVQQTVGDLRAQISAAARHHAQGFEQVRFRHFLQNEAPRAGAHRAHHRVFVVIHRKDHDLASGMMAQNFRGGLDAAQPGEANVHQHQVGLMQFYKLQRAGASLRFPHHAKFRVASQDGLDAVPHDLVVIHQKYVEGHSGSRRLYPFPPWSQS